MTILDKEQQEVFKDKKYFIIEKFKGYGGDRHTIHNNSMYDIETAMRKLLALDTLNEDRENNSYHLQEVNFSMVDKPLVLTDEVKEEQSEMPF